MARFEKRFFANLDWVLLLATILICATGIGILSSAGFNPNLGYSPSMTRQAVSMGMGFAALLFFMFVNPNVWKRSAFFIYAAACILLALVLVIGVSGGGAKRWIILAGIRVQPSEFMKLALIFAVAKICSSDSAPRSGYSFMTLWLPALVILVPFMLTLHEPDLGTAMSQALVGGSIIYLFGVQRKTFTRLAMIGLIGLVPFWFTLKDYQRLRVLNFLSPERDPLGTGYHAIQSKIAVGSGQLLGKGYMQGTQTQLRFLPEQTTDFIFSVLAEEWGFIGTCAVLFLYALIIFRLFRITSRCQDKFSSFVCFGVAAMLFWHMLINIGMVIGILPVVGITLPMLSFGGSSVVTLMSGIGIALGISSRRFAFA